MILCGQSARHLYVANALIESADVCAIIHESGTQFSFNRLRKYLSPRFVFSKIWRWIRDRRRYTNNNETQFFFPLTSPHLLRPELVRFVSHINHPQVVTWANELNPDMVCVFGTSLIRGPLLEAGQLGMVNLHGGLSPEYRGADCTFWALFNEEPEKIGCTLHFINAGIDTGAIVAHVCPEIRASDDELTLFWRAVKESAAVYADFLKKSAEGARFGLPQTEKGRLYQVKDRQLRHERSLSARLSAGMLHGRELPARVHWFIPETSGTL